MRSLPVLGFTIPAVLIAALGAAVPVAAAKSPTHNNSAQDEARILHALNRLTFGPRPGDIAAVRKMGLHAWIEQQLHPETIDDSALGSRLAQYPIMHMDVADMLRELPPPPIIRQVINGKYPMPQSGPLSAVYATQVAEIELRQQGRAEKAAETAARQQGMQNTSVAEATAQTTQSGDAESDMRRKKLFADLQATGVVNLAPEARMQKILAMQPVERVNFFHGLNADERRALYQGLTPQQVQTVAAMRNPVRVVASQLEAAKMLRVVESNRQLQQVMDDFWMNHFNVDIRKSPLMAYYLTEYERRVIAPNALGNFESLLIATAESPAMMLYLDNSSSVGPHSVAAAQFERRNSMAPPDKRRPAPGINENYGRELMELHTLGVNGGYTQQDVIEVAKAFTGWGIQNPAQGGGFVYNPRRHEPGPKHILGHTIQENGQQEGLEVLHMLASSPATAHHISMELAERFVSGNPPRPLVDRMAKTFLKTHGDIRQVLGTMFNSPEFWAKDTLNAKVKTPLEFVASAARASSSQVIYPLALAIAVRRLGMPLYNCQPPTGYSPESDAWVSSGSLVERMNFSMAFAGNHLPGVTNDWDALIGGNAAEMTPSEKEAALEEILLPGQISAHTHDAIMKDLVDNAGVNAPHPFPLGGLAQGYLAPVTLDITAQPPTDRSAALMAGLLLGSPEFQSR
jgi:uncharacterized protein (DUF1800 family)